MFFKVHVRAPYGPLWISYGHGNIRMFSFAGTVRSRVGLGIPVRSVVQGRTGSGGDHEFKFGLYLPSQTRLCDIWHVRTNKTTNWPSMGTKPLVAYIWKLYMLNLQPRDIWRPHNLKIFETSCELTMHVMWFPTGTGLALRLSESFIWCRNKISNASVACMKPTGVPSP